MERNKVEFQKGLSEAEFQRLYGSEELCVNAGEIVVVYQVFRELFLGRPVFGAAASSNSHKSAINAAGRV